MLSAEALRALHARERLVDRAEAVMGDGVAVSIDLSGAAVRQGAPADGNGIVGYRAKRHTAVIEVERRAAYEVADFWEPIAARADQSLILDPDEFYILASTEAVQVPPDYAAEMVPFDPLVGEFRVHYAGFFDPGFGYAGAGGLGSRAVLEVRSREVPFILEHGQIVGRLVYEKMLARPDQLYGSRHRLELSGPGPQIVETFSRLSGSISAADTGKILVAFLREGRSSVAGRRRLDKTRAAHEAGTPGGLGRAGFRGRDRPRAGRRTNPATTGPAAITPARRCRTAIRRSARAAASTRRTAGPGAFPTRRRPARRRCAFSSAKWCRGRSRAAAYPACAAPA